MNFVNYVQIEFQKLIMYINAKYYTLMDSKSGIYLTTVKSTYNYLHTLLLKKFKASSFFPAISS